MMQKDDRKYTFVVSHSNRRSIRVRRIGISKRLINVGAGVVFLALGFEFYNSPQQKSYEQSLINTQTQSSKSFIVNKFGKFYSSKPASSTNLNEGGPDVFEPSETEDEFGRINNEYGEINSGDFTPSIYPLVGKINNEFGWRRNPFEGGGYEHHGGMDIDGVKGDPIFASANGIVLKTGWHGGYGNLIEIDHGNGTTTRYGHLSAIAVEVGEAVVRGQEIGAVGSTGRSTGPHLHYEVRLNGASVNPRNYLPKDDLLMTQP